MSNFNASSDALLAALAALLAGVGEGVPLNLNVSLTPSERVQELEKQVAALTNDLATLQRDYNRVEYLFFCESKINQRIQDYCAENGFRLPRSLYRGDDPS